MNKKVTNLLKKCAGTGALVTGLALGVMDIVVHKNITPMLFDAGLLASMGLAVIVDSSSNKDESVHNV